MRWFRVHACVWIAAVVLLEACDGGTSYRPPALPPPPSVELLMKEFSYTPSAKEIVAGRTIFKLANRGKQYHQPTLLILPEDLPPILQQIRGSTRRVVDPLVNNSGLAPGVTGTIAVDLRPGQRYAFVCYAKTPDGQDHAQLGMVWEFRAGEARPADFRPSRQ